MKYKAVMQFAIHIPIENRSIDHNSFTDEDVDFFIHEVGRTSITIIFETVFGRGRDSILSKRHT